jgi:hypothetical protein
MAPSPLRTLWLGHDVDPPGAFEFERDRDCCLVTSECAGPQFFRNWVCGLSDDRGLAEEAKQEDEGEGERFSHSSLDLIDERPNGGLGQGISQSIASRPVMICRRFPVTSFLTCLRYIENWDFSSLSPKLTLGNSSDIGWHGCCIWEGVLRGFRTVATPS